MRLIPRFAAAAALLAAPPVVAPAQEQRPTRAAGAASGVAAHEIDGHLRFVSHDLLEGRGPATRGGELAAQCIGAQLRAFGVEPGAANGSYFQCVPIDVVTADSATFRVAAYAGQGGAPAPAALRVPHGALRPVMP